MGALVQYGGVLIILKIASTRKNHKYFSGKSLYGCIPVAKLATAIIAANDKEIMQDNINHMLKARKVILMRILWKQPEHLFLSDIFLVLIHIFTGETSVPRKDNGANKNSRRTKPCPN